MAQSCETDITLKNLSATSQQQDFFGTYFLDKLSIVVFTSFSLKLESFEIKVGLILVFILSCRALCKYFDNMCGLGRGLECVRVVSLCVPEFVEMNVCLQLILP